MNPSIHPLRSFALAVALTVAAVSSSAYAADSPAAILKDYQSRAESALAKPNKILETQAAAIAASLLRAGASAEAEQVTTQMKLKAAGDPVPMPVSAAADLFKKYDSARAAALKPLQEQAIARIDALTRTPAGQDVSSIAELARVRGEIEHGKTNVSAFNWLATWEFFKNRQAPADGSVTFNADGTAVFTSRAGNKTLGKWTTDKSGTGINVSFPADEWNVMVRKSGIEVKGKTWQDVAYLSPKS